MKFLTIPSACLTVSRSLWAKRLVYMSVAAAVVLVVSIGEAAAQSKRVLLLHSLQSNFKFWSEYGEAIRAELRRQSPWPLEIIDHTLLPAHSDDENPEGPLVEYLNALYAKRPPDLIISIGAPATSFAQRHRQQIFSTIPLLITAVEQRRIQPASLTEYDTVVATVNDDRTNIFETMLQMLPDTKNVEVVIGTSAVEQFWAGEIRKELKPLESRLTFSWYNHLPFTDILKRASELPPHSAIYFSLFSVDAAGVVHDGEDPLIKLHAVAKAPIFSVRGDLLGKGIVGGRLISVPNLSRQAAVVAVRILGGEKPADIKVPPVGFSTPKYDWRQLQRWNISESRLPPGSEILFREPGAWQRYRWQMIALFGVLLLQGFTITGLLYEDRRRRLAEGQVKQRMSELAHLNRISTAGELTVSIAHEMSQPLTAILANVQALQLMLKSPAPDINEMHEIADDIGRDDVRAGEVIQRLRSLLKRAPFEVKPVDLNEIVRETIALLSSQASARQVDVSTAFGSPSLPISGDRIQLQQVVMNLIVNAMDAMSENAAFDRRVTIWTALRDEFAEVAIADAGPGIPPVRLNDVFQPFFTTKAHGMGMGLSIARTITEAHNGTISAHNQAKGGAVFRIRLPLRKS
jgi:signal transduction histidine kinase